jgi:hypothetical protein
LVGFCLASDNAADEEAAVEKLGEDVAAKKSIGASEENSLRHFDDIRDLDVLGRIEQS